MHARVATFEGEQGEIQKMVEGIRQNSESGPPEGVPAKELLLLKGRESGKVVAIVLFESEDDMRQGDETLNTMNPPDAEGVRRTSVELFDVGAHVRA